MSARHRQGARAMGRELARYRKRLDAEAAARAQSRREQPLNSVLYQLQAYADALSATDAESAFMRTTITAVADWIQDLEVAGAEP
jgi:hypothetical protein